MTYLEMAEELPRYVKEMGSTHVEFLPVYEHPLDDSWNSFFSLLLQIKFYHKIWILSTAFLIKLDFKDKRLYNEIKNPIFRQ